MEDSEASRATAAAISTVASLGLTVDGATVLHNSNKLTLRLLPCDVVARISTADLQCAQFEIDLAQPLVAAGCPVAALDKRAEPRVYQRDEFAITLWTYYEPVASSEASPVDYADALQRLHVGMRSIDVATPHFTDRIAEAEQLVVSRERTPELGDDGRKLLTGVLRDVGRAVSRRGRDQLLHGEPHAGNVLRTRNGLLFIDLETCCRGPVEFDLAHAPEQVSEHYPDLDRELLRDCRVLVLAMITTWRFEPGDELPNGRARAAEWLTLLADYGLSG